MEAQLSVKQHEHKGKTKGLEQGATCRLHVIVCVLMVSLDVYML